MILVEKWNDSIREVAHVYTRYKGEMLSWDLLIVDKAVDLVSGPMNIFQSWKCIIDAGENRHWYSYIL